MAAHPVCLKGLPIKFIGYEYLKKLTNTPQVWS